MRTTDEGCPRCGTRDNRLLRLTILEKQMIFGLPFQQWTADDWAELFGELPSGWEYAA